MGIHGEYRTRLTPRTVSHGNFPARGSEQTRFASRPVDRFVTGLRASSSGEPSMKPGEVRDLRARAGLGVMRSLMALPKKMHEHFSESPSARLFFGGLMPALIASTLMKVGTYGADFYHFAIETWPGRIMAAVGVILSLPAYTAMIWPSRPARTMEGFSREIDIEAPRPKRPPARTREIEGGMPHSGLRGWVTEQRFGGAVAMGAAIAVSMALVPYAIGPTLITALASFALKNFYIVFAASFLIPLVHGAITGKRSSEIYPSYKNSLYELAQKRPLLGAALLLGLGALGASTLFGWGSVGTWLAGRPFKLGGALGFLSLYSVLPLFNGLINSAKENPPPPWLSDNGVVFKYIRRFPKLLGGPALLTWGWVMTELFTGYSGFGKEVLIPFVQDHVFGAALMTGFTLKGIPIVRALFPEIDMVRNSAFVPLHTKVPKKKPTLHDHAYALGRFRNIWAARASWLLGTSIIFRFTEAGIAGKALGAFFGGWSGLADAALVYAFSLCAATSLGYFARNKPLPEDEPDGRTHVTPPNPLVDGFVIDSKGRKKLRARWRKPLHYYERDEDYYALQGRDVTL